MTLVPRASRWPAGRWAGRRAAAGLVLGVLFATPVAMAAPDSLEFRNGRVLIGELVSDEGDIVTFRVDGGVISFPRSLVAKVHLGVSLSEELDESASLGGAIRPAGRDEAPASATAASRMPVAAEEWFLVLAGERRVGWRHCQARRDADGFVFEEEFIFLDAEGGVEARTRLIEEAGLDLRPRGFDFRESAQGKESRRTGRMVADRLEVRVDEGEQPTVTDHAVPRGFRLPLAARAFVLHEGPTLPGGWRGTSYDPRQGAFFEMALLVSHRERVPWEGEGRDVSVLVRTRGTVREEERVTDAGVTLTAELNGPSIVAVCTTAERAQAVGAGKALDPSVEEIRARSVFASAEDGFRVRKPGLAWEFVSGARDANPRLTVRDVGGMVFVTVSVEPAPEGATAAGLGAALQRRLAASSGEFNRVEDGFVRLRDVEAFRLLCDARLKGDHVRTLALTALHRGRVWTLMATCPLSSWEEARPHIERILDGFEWL